MDEHLTPASPIWTSLVAETQFATELALTGLRRLCSVPTDPEVLQWTGNDLNYALHVGMYSYSSGLERLCKLAIACNGYVTTGEFPNLRKYSHKIGDLLDTVEALIPEGPGASMHKAKYLLRPEDDLDPELMNTVERFANGTGRYEHLDSLWKEDAKINTYSEWSALAARVSVSTEVHDLIGLKVAMTYAIRSELSDDGLESTAQMAVEELELPMYAPSVGVVLSLFRKVRHVSAILNVATYYTGRGLPILGEIVNPNFVLPSVSFFKYNIARISDDDAVVEELQPVYERIRRREAEWDDEGLE